MIETNTIPNVISGHNIQPVLPTVPCNVVYHEDCMEGLKRFPDNYFDLAVVDPPYGIGEDGRKGVRTSPSRPNSYNREPKYAAKGWDNEPPSKYYFIELLRVSKNAIVWGANHFIERIPNQNSSCWIVWDKKNEGTDFADCELAWTNMKTAVRKYTIHKFEGTRGGKDCIHPTQKPVKLYEWIYSKYAQQGYKILDTHIGSGSSRIAAHKAGLSFVGFEIDADYYAAQEKRFKTFTSQLRMF
jgi:site-specific DNA-methyltransferase (adenine-specific)